MAARGQKVLKMHPRMFPLFQGLDTNFEEKKKKKQLKHEIKLDKDVRFKNSHLP